jgi:amino acid transporter
MSLSRLRTFLFGRPLRTEEDVATRIGPLVGIPVLGLDAMASASYGPEAALTVLLPLGTAAIATATPLLLVIVLLLIVVQTSYRQTIAAYPDGGGSYAVARHNLGQSAGLMAGAALFIDYVLNVAVAISAGVGAVISSWPAAQPYTLWLCLLILLVIAVLNLRGVRDSGAVFLLPTYAFVALLGGVIVLGLIRGGPTGGPLAQTDSLAGTASTWLLLRAFSAGCTAMTGIEAVSNAVPVFRAPAPRNAQRTLAAITAILALLITGLAIVCRRYGIAATVPGRPGYQSVLSRVTATVVGRGAFFHATMASVAAVLCLSANTSFAGFPRLGRLLAQDGFLPASFAHRSARLVYSRGIVLLTVMSGALLVAFDGITDRLIPLFAVGAFLAFTLSQLGMVAHWKRQPAGRRHRGALIINAAGAVATAATLVVIVVSKFTEGAWITVTLLAALMALFTQVRRHQTWIDRQISIDRPMEFRDLDPPLVVVPLKRLDQLASRALRLAMSISDEVVALEILSTGQDERDLSASWATFVEQPARAAGAAVPKLVILRSSYREIIGPIVRHIQRLARTNPRRSIAVLVPELVERRWYDLLLHGHTATLLKAMLLLRGGPQIAIINTPWYVDEVAEKPPG